ncbi:MAG: caspase family protein [Candidatus Polarisedimenticolaceae bacterium]|nr:caspase family protein [Candidatus Polarisedimenticolaceae bacterium]
MNMHATSHQSEASVWPRLRGLILIATLSGGLSGCVTSPVERSALDEIQGRVSADQLMPVDCLLPAQVRKLGAKMVYLAARKAIKTTALVCEIRGGEYVAFDRADYRTSLNVWLERAHQGDAEAQSYVGEIYEKGLGLPSDYKTAFVWYTKAAEQGYSRAQINLGYLYEKGLGVKKNSLTAFNWYRKASGVDGSEIDYAAAIEVKAASLAQEQNALLRQEINRRTADIKQLKSSLTVAYQASTESRVALDISKQQLVNLQRQLESSSEEPRINELKRSYAAQQQKVTQLESRLSQLADDAAKMTRTLDRKSSQVSQQTTLLIAEDTLGPSIEVFDPSIVITRGGLPKVRVRSGGKVRVISGRIDAPSGLKAATINGQAITLDSSGLFNAAVTISEGEKRVLIQVIDQSGQRAEFSFMLVTEQRAKRRDVDATHLSRVAGSVDFGRYYALVIGNNEYQNYSPLQTAINDAQSVAKILTEQFGFDTRFIRNADRYTILSALNEVKGKLTEKDNLLIYYAGHGERDVTTLQGYWLPVDAEQENSANWISNSAISDLLNTMPAKHILVVADSCYSGSMTRSSVARMDIQLDDKQQEKWLKVMAKTASRTVLTSGGIAPVLDSGGGANSVFARAFLDQLEDANGLIDAYKIYLNVSPQVQKNAASIGFKQSPTYAPIKFTGHSGGEFIFVKSSG